VLTLPRKKVEPPQVLFVWQKRIPLKSWTTSCWANVFFFFTLWILELKMPKLFRVKAAVPKVGLFIFFFSKKFQASNYHQKLPLLSSNFVRVYFWGNTKVTILVSFHGMHFNHNWRFTDNKTVDHGFCPRPLSCLTYLVVRKDLLFFFSNWIASSEHYITAC